MLTILKSILLTTCLMVSYGSIANEKKNTEWWKSEGERLQLFNKFDSAAVIFQQIKAAAKEKGDDALYVYALNRLSETYASVYEPDKAEEAAKEAIRISDEKFGVASLEHLVALNNLGNAHYLKGKHAEALIEFNKVMKQYNELPEDKRIVLASPLNLGIGNVYYSKYQYREALNYFKHALDVNIKHYGTEHPSVAYVYMSIGNLYRNMGSFGNAREHYDKASRLLLRYFGETHPAVAMSYIGLADLYTSGRQFDQAIQYYLRAQGIYEQFFKPQDPRFGDIYLGYGDVYKGEAEYEKAVENYKKALDIYMNSVGKEHQNTVKANLEIGNSYMYQEEILKALEYYNKVLEINYMLVGELHTNTSGAYNNLGGVYYFMGNYALALNYYERALAIDKTIYGNDHPNVANSYYNIARVYSEKGNSEKALEYIQLAINSSIINFDKSDIYTNPALLNYFDDKDLMWYLNFKGETLEAGFKVNANVKGLDVALHSFVLSDSLIDKIRESYTNTKDQAELTKLTTKIYASAVNSAYALTKLITPENVKYIDRDARYAQKLKEYKEKLFYFTEKSKACMLFSSVAKANARNFGGVPDTLLQKEVDLKTAISQYTQELYIHTDPEIKKQIATKMVKANREYEDLLRTLSDKFPKYHGLKYDKGIVSVGQIQEFLGDSSLLISYLISKDNLYIVSISREDIQIHKELYTDEVAHRVRGLRNGIMYQLDETYVENARWLYKKLFPFTIPSKYKHIVVIPDGPMHLVPYEALLTEEVSGQRWDYRDMPYAVKKYSFSYTYSANLLYRIFKNKATLRPKAPKEAYALAPVKFNYVRGDSTHREIEKYPSLYGTESELELLKSVFSRNNKQLITNIKEEANEEQLKQNTPADFKYLHLATHGFMKPENAEKSGILLYQKDAKEDGILYAGEIYNIQLNAELVVMSACETGLGKTSFGEGLVGLGRSLLYAGAKNLTLSLWTVDDEATKELMHRLYTHIVPLAVPAELDQSLNYAPYLRLAKLELMQESRFSMPYYWAPFVLHGK